MFPTNCYFLREIQRQKVAELLKEAELARLLKAANPNIRTGYSLVPAAVLLTTVIAFLVFVT